MQQATCCIAKTTVHMLTYQGYRWLMGGTLYLRWMFQNGTTHR